MQSVTPSLSPLLSRVFFFVHLRSDLASVAPVERPELLVGHALLVVLIFQSIHLLLRIGFLPVARGPAEMVSTTIFDRADARARPDWW